MDRFYVFLAGVAAGAAVLTVAMMISAPSLMLGEVRSAHGLDATVRILTETAEGEGWVVSSVQPLDRSVRNHGGPELRPVRLVNVCQADHAGRILGEDEARIVSVMMPCTLSVYEKSDGSVWVGHMNPGLMGRLFGGVVSEVMAGPVAETQARFIDAVR